MPRVLVAACDDTLRIIKPAIDSHANLLTAPRIEEALRLAGTRIDAVVCDCCFDDCRMFALLYALKVRRRGPPPPVICCGRGAPSERVREAVEAAAGSLGACSFVDLALLTQRYDRTVAGEILAQMVRRRIEQRSAGVVKRGQRVVSPVRHCAACSRSRAARAASARPPRRQVI